MPNPNHIPRDDSRLLRDFHRRAADRRRIELAKANRTPAMAPDHTALKREAVPQRRITRQLATARVPVHRTPAGAGQAAAFPDAGLESFNLANAAVEAELKWVNEAMGRKVLPDRAHKLHAQAMTNAASCPDTAEAKARSAFGFLSSMSNALTSVGTVPPSRRVKSDGQERHLKNRSASEHVFDALNEAIPHARTLCAADAERAALNGATAASMMANLVQGPTRISLISKEISRLAADIEQLKQRDDPAASAELPQKLKTLKATIWEAQTLYPAMQAKVRALAKVADEAIAGLVKDAQHPKLKGTDRTEIQKAVTLCTTMKLALDQLNEAYADPDWVYGKLDQYTESVRQDLVA